MSKNTDRSIDIDETFPLVHGRYGFGDQPPNVALRFFDRCGILASSGWETLYGALGSLESTLEDADESTLEDADAYSAAILAAEEAVAAALDACPEYVVDLHSGEAIDDEEVAAAIAKCDWTGLWPIIDGDCCLTGEVVDNSSDGYLSCDWGGMIEAADARAAGWRINTEEGTATPSEPVTVEFATADETIRDRGFIDYVAGLEHPAMPEACAAYRRAAIIAMADDDRANRLRDEAPRDRRILHSQWCGAHWGYSAGAIGTMAGDLTSDERAAIDAAHEAGLEAARAVIEAEDAAAPRLMDYHTREDIRAATAEEIDASADAGPEGVILLAADGSILRADDAGADEARRVYVQNDK
jgi:hypothetical protein